MDINDDILWPAGRRHPRAGAAGRLCRDGVGMKIRPTIVCLCGSTRFSQAFREASLSETLAGRIVLSIGCDMRSDQEIFGHMTPSQLKNIKAMLDELHLRKIDLADEVLILNVGGYVGESTARELAYARQHGKPVRWWEPDKAVWL